MGSVRRRRFQSEGGPVYRITHFLVDEADWTTTALWYERLDEDHNVIELVITLRKSVDELQALQSARLLPPLLPESQEPPHPQLPFE